MFWVFIVAKHGNHLCPVCFHWILARINHFSSRTLLVSSAQIPYRDYVSKQMQFDFFLPVWFAFGFIFLSYNFFFQVIILLELGPYLVVLRGCSQFSGWGCSQQSSGLEQTGAGKPTLGSLCLCASILSPSFQLPFCAIFKANSVSCREKKPITHRVVLWFREVHLFITLNLHNLEKHYFSNKPGFTPFKSTEHYLHITC